MDNQLQSVLRYLQDNKLKLVTAESCTAGMIASTLADEPGSGSWLECAFVTYSEEAKMRYIDVKPETIERYNLTSEQVAREMAEGALKAANANVAIANTGVAGPGPGEGGIPPGTICFAWSFEHDGGITTYTETRHFDGDRNAVRRAGTDYAINRVWHYHNTLPRQQDR
jgi:nicotinamide-nucleotide amidase